MGMLTDLLSTLYDEVQRSFPLMRRLFVAYGEGFFASSEGGLGLWDGGALSCWCVAAEMDENCLRRVSADLRPRRSQR